VEGINIAVEQLLGRVQQNHGVVSQLASLEGKTAKTKLDGFAKVQLMTTLFTILQEEELPPLLDVRHIPDILPPRHDDPTLLGATSHIESVDGQNTMDGGGMLGVAVATVREAACSLQDLTEETRGVCASLQSSFGDSSTAAKLGSQLASSTNIGNGGGRRATPLGYVPLASLADTMRPTANLVLSAVSLKCTCTAKFLREVEAELLSRPSPRQGFPSRRCSTP
jgi:hypothetical protein